MFINNTRRFSFEIFFETPNKNMNSSSQVCLYNCHKIPKSIIQMSLKVYITIILLHIFSRSGEFCLKMQMGDYILFCHLNTSSTKCVEIGRKTTDKSSMMLNGTTEITLLLQCRPKVVCYHLKPIFLN